MPNARNPFPGPIPYNDFTSFMQRKYPGIKLQKVSVNAGFTCPNRDGAVGRGGCSYCFNPGFNPNYKASSKSIKGQILQAMERFRKRTKPYKFLAYFQSFTNTYAPLGRLQEAYGEALAVDGVVGLAIGTRPDCLEEPVLEYLEGLAQDYEVSLEIGIESTSDQTLAYINRGHTFAQARDAFFRAARHGLETTGHLIIGLPGETQDDFLRHAREISQLPIQRLKLHQLQVLKGTFMEKQLAREPSLFAFPSPAEYVGTIIRFLEHLRPDIVIERFTSQSPHELIIAPNWHGIRNFEMAGRIQKQMIAQDTWQGKYFNTDKA